MKSSDRSILLGLLIVGLGAAFWFMVLSPKREEAAELETEVAALESEVANQEQLALAADEARQGYDRSYGRLVTLGKAAPENGDTPSLLIQLTDMSDRAGVLFERLEIADADPTQAPTAAAQTTTDQNLAAGATTESTAAGASTETTGAAATAETTTTTTTTAPPATEAGVAPLTTGATVGTAGLTLQNYTMNFTGDFFEVADLLEMIDNQVSAADGKVRVDGRLMTVDGFSMAVGEQGGSTLDVELTASAYILPPEQGLTAGATPGAPPAAVPAAPAPTPVATP